MSKSARWCGEAIGIKLALDTIPASQVYDHNQQQCTKIPEIKLSKSYVFQQHWLFVKYDLQGNLPFPCIPCWNSSIAI